MFQFLNISKQNITALKNTTIHCNAHFITDSSQAWIFSNTKRKEGVCEVFIHYISAANNQKMMLEQPLWRGYLASEIKDSQVEEQIVDHINQPLFHIILNVHEDYKYLMGNIVSFIQGILRKKNPEVKGIVIDTFVYREVYELETENMTE